MLLGAGPGLNLDFARLSFHVPAIALGACADGPTARATTTPAVSVVRITRRVIPLLLRSQLIREIVPASSCVCQSGTSSESVAVPSAPPAETPVTEVASAREPFTPALLDLPALATEDWKALRSEEASVERPAPRGRRWGALAAAASFIVVVAS